MIKLHEGELQALVYCTVMHHWSNFVLMWPATYLVAVMSHSLTTSLDYNGVKIEIIWHLFVNKKMKPKLILNTLVLLCPLVGTLCPIVSKFFFFFLYVGFSLNFSQFTVILSEQYQA